MLPAPWCRLLFGVSLLLAQLAQPLEAYDIVGFYHESCDTPFVAMMCSAMARLATNFPGLTTRTQRLVGTPTDACVAEVAATGGQVADMLVFMGFDYLACAETTAAAYPEAWVVLVDSCPASVPPNLLCVLFAEERPAYVAGYLAGLASRSKVIGVVGGVPVLPVMRFFNGFLVGVRASCPECRVEGMYVNSFSHPANARAVAGYLVSDLGADVVHGCGGHTGSVAILRAAELGALVMGVDVDEFGSTFANESQEIQARLLTSVTKRVDAGVELAVTLLKDLAAGVFPESIGNGQTLLMDYTNGGVGIADCHLACGSVSPATWMSVRRLEAQLSAGVQSVPLIDSFIVPTLHANAQPNTLHLAPNVAAPPAPRRRAAVAAFNAVWTDFLVVFGGANLTHTFNDLWLYNVQSAKWLDGDHGMTTGVPPPPLAKACAVAFGLSVVIFGGRTQNGEQANGFYSYTYQPSFVGFGDPASSAIVHAWATLPRSGATPLPVEGPACAPLNSSCGILFGGRGQITETNSVHLFCAEGGGTVQVERLSPLAGGPEPAPRESAGAAVVNATALGLPGVAGDLALLVAGGTSAGQPRTDVWFLALNGAAGGTGSWLQLPDLPDAQRSAPLVFAAPSGGHGTSLVLVVQPSSAAANSGLGAYTYDPSQGEWNTQATAFAAGAEQAGALSGAALINSVGQMWFFGGTVDGDYQNSLLTSAFTVQTVCGPGKETQGVSCVDCGPGNYSQGGLGATCISCVTGTFAEAVAASSCSPCSAGHYAAQPGQSECQPCGAGRYKSSGPFLCEPCPAGSFGTDQGQQRAFDCEPCPAGRYTGTATGASNLDACEACPGGRSLTSPLGRAECDPCSRGTFWEAGICSPCTPGQFQDAEGSTGCSECPRGEYAEEAQRSACEACRPGTVASDHGQTACQHCQLASYQPERGRQACLLCGDLIPGSTTQILGAASADVCLCPEGTFLRASDGNGTEGACTSCLQGMTCPFGSDVRNFGSRAGPIPLTQEGYMTRTTDVLKVYKCLRTDMCPGGPPGACGGFRDEQAVGCGRCVRDANEIEGSCFKCRGGANAVTLISVTFLTLAAVVTLTIMVNRKLIAQTGPLLLCVALCGLMLTGLQAMGIFRQMDIPWPEPVSTLLRIVSLASFDLKFLQIDCVFGVGIVGGYVLQLMIAPSCLVVVGATLLVKKVRLPGTDVLAEFANTAGTFYTVFFISIVVSSVSPLMCYDHPPGSGSSVINNPAVLCMEGDDWTRIFSVGLTMLFIIPLPFMTLTICGALKYPTWIQNRTVTNARLLFAFRFACFRFVPSRYYYSSFILLRGLLMCFVPVVFRFDVGLQVCMLVAILCVFVMLQQQLGPWRSGSQDQSRAVNIIDGALNHMLVLLLVCGAMASGMQSGSLAVAIVAAVALLCVPVTALAGLAGAFYQKFRPWGRYDLFICHHKAGAAAQARYLKMLLQSRSKHVFIDSDDLKDLNSLFEIVKTKVARLVVYLTRDTLSRPWCSGEIVVAVQFKVDVTTIQTPSYAAPAALDPEQLETVVYQTGCNLVEHGISLADVAAAYKAILGPNTPSIVMDVGLQGSQRLEALVPALLGNRPSPAAARAKLLAPAAKVMTPVVVSADPSSEEAIATACIINGKVQEHVFRFHEAGLCLLPDHDCCDLEVLRQVVTTAGAVLVVLSSQSLQAVAQVRVIIEGMLADRSRMISVSLPEFAYPTDGYYTEMVPRIWPGDAACACDCMRSFLRLISVTMNVGASDQMLGAQCQEIVARLQAVVATNMRNNSIDSGGVAGCSIGSSDAANWQDRSRVENVEPKERDSDEWSL